MLFLSGVSVTGTDTVSSRSVSSQVPEMMGRLRAALGDRGLSLEHLVRVEAFLKETSKVHEFLAAWRREVGPSIPATVIGAGPSGLVSASASIQLDVTATLDDAPHRLGRDSTGRPVADVGPSGECQQ
ncbi:MAG TPA: hypothetical protein VMS99_14580 [Acidimicrobiia bacterium]|nr:hypothetical protein [Acidimicrobiia bacterium]